MQTEHETVTLARVRSMAANGEARAIRIAARLALAEVAAACGVSTVTVYRWETGERSPRAKAALRYATLLDALTRVATDKAGNRSA